MRNRECNISKSFRPLTSVELGLSCIYILNATCVYMCSEICATERLISRFRRRRIYATTKCDRIVWWSNAISCGTACGAIVNRRRAKVFWLT